MSTQERTQDMYYTVVGGDTLSAIAARYGTTVKQLQIWNHIPDPNIIKIGQRLLVRKGEVEGGRFLEFPGKDFFRSGTDSPIIGVMGYRLVQVGCSCYGPDGPQTQWNEEHRASYAMWQRSLGYHGADADGIPGPTSWDRLEVPYPGTD